MNTHDPAHEPQSVFQSSLPLEIKLERARTELLDLSARNRLLNMPRSAKSAKTVEVIDEQSREVYRLLVKEQRPFTFLPGRQASEQTGEEGDEIVELAQPENEGVDERGIATRHADTRLQTRLTPAGLQKRLLDLYYDARTLEEEQGVNILFLALASLKWVDPINPANIRYAPLILIPVALERGNAAEKFKLRWRQEDAAANLSLEAYLDRVHGIKLPAFEASDDFDPAGYIAKVAEAVEAKKDWAVNPNDIVLGFFSFAKFLMYRDLDPATWPADSKLAEHELVRSLVSDGFDEGEPLLSEDEPVDAHVAPSSMVHIVDSDSSQTMAVHEVRRGRNLVIQGPPGTGKSQTIANVIASAVADGKTVLFVAEKMAALEVVKRRLDHTGVGDVCLELHSNKANKRAVLEELRRTWELGTPKGEDLATLNARLTEARDRLNEHARRLHASLGAAGFTPYQVIGQLTRLKQAGQQPTDLALDRSSEWTVNELHERSGLLAELIERVRDIGVPAQHVWRGIELEAALPPDVDRLVKRIEELLSRLDALRDDGAALATILELPEPATLATYDDLTQLASRLAEAPDLEPNALGAEEWADRNAEIAVLVTAGERLAKLGNRLAPVFKPAAWAAELAPAAETLAPLPASMTLEAFARAGLLADQIPTLLEDAKRLSQALGRVEAPPTMRGIDEMVRVADRVACAPAADAGAFAAELWENGVEQAADLAKSVEVLEKARSDIGAGLSENAWDVDLSDARRVLAAHGAGFFRWFSGEWRTAARTARSYLSNPKSPLEQQLALLDALGRGRRALETISAEDQFGRTAFASAWRGGRSQSAPLIALVEWMRSLKGLGAEPRLVASKGPDREEVSSLTSRLRAKTEALRGSLTALWDDLGAARDVAFSSAGEAALAELELVQAATAQLSNAHNLYVRIAVIVDSSLQVRREALAELAEGQQLAARIDQQAELGQRAFGSIWNGPKSEWDTLRGTAEWIIANLDIHGLAARVGDRPALLARCQEAASARDRLVEAGETLIRDVKATAISLIAPGTLRETAIDGLNRSLCEWRDESEQLSKWVAYRTRANKAIALDLRDLVQRLHDGKVVPEDAQTTFEMAYFEAVFGDQVKRDPELAQFDGDLHNRLVQTFSDLDRQRIRQSALEVVRAHHKCIPPQAGGKVGPLGTLRGEIAKKRGHMPIRKLMHQAGVAIQALKPVFMMSPLSVAQFLEPGSITFDLLVMDEASQIQPVDALGAIARCRQVVVVGDPQQLPPTAFFAKMTGNSDGADEEDVGARVADIESILGLFTARGLPMRMLRWHYRSRHESLIAVSNRQFYENKLFIVPSPYTAQAGMGLRFHHIADGVFESGTTRTNPIEAKAVARAIVEHAISHPELSLGVVAFSAAQRRAILDQVELLRRVLPAEHEAFFQAHPAEPFFIKNLENVQGDERDVIFISVGYGPTAPGLKPPMRFGPLGQDGGERRLNVIISRAKRRCEIFASMTDEDIDPDFASTRKGVFAFKMFMHFARTGRMTIAEPSARDPDSMFEEQVAEALHARGYQVHRQVGIAGFFIDLAIADPERADRYLLGIECDGAAYHDARSARDRDRLRQAILEDHGWIIQRIWSTDWFRRPKAELERVVAAIEAAKVELAARGERESRRRPATLEIVSVDREHVTEMGLVAVEAPEPAPVAYVEANISRPSHLSCELHEAPTGILTQLAEQVVAIEGPVHIDEIINRIRDAWSLKRAGGRIQEVVERAVLIAVRQNRLMEEDWFYSVPHGEVVVRDRSAARSPTLRKPNMLPPAEIRVAILEIIGRNFGATEEQVVQAAARAFGFKSTSAQLRQTLIEVLEAMLKKQELTRRDALIELGPSAPVKAAKEPEPTPLERLIGVGESEKVEFKQTLRWDVRQQAINKKLEEVAVKTIAAFANGSGGTLLIGVCDDGSVTGIDQDVSCLGGSFDKFELHLTNLLNAHFPTSFWANRVKVTFPSVGPIRLCRVDVERSRTPLYIKVGDRNGIVAERFFVRSGNSSHEVPASQIASYVREHFEQVG